MSDKEKLKALAQAATPGNWVTDGDYVNEQGNVLYAYVAHESGGRIAEAFANCLVKTDEQCRSNAAFIAAANPVTVLALLAEIERIPACVRTEQKFSKKLSADLGRAQVEVAELKAENEALRKDLESHKRMLLGAAVDIGAIGEALGAEMDDDPSELEGLAVELRKDAERYRWLRDPGNQEDFEPGSDYLMPPIVCGYVEHEDILSLEVLDKAIDAAMPKEAQP